MTRHEPSRPALSHHGKSRADLLVHNNHAHYTSERKKKNLGTHSQSPSSAFALRYPARRGEAAWRTWGPGAVLALATVVCRALAKAGIRTPARHSSLLPLLSLPAFLIPFSPSPSSSLFTSCPKRLRFPLPLLLLPLPSHGEFRCHFWHVRMRAFKIFKCISVFAYI